MRCIHRLGYALLLCMACLPGHAAPPHRTLPVVLLSIDGLKPEYLQKADALGLKIPNLRKLQERGAFSFQVRGVLPTITYPSHTTLITGASPDRHGIECNGTFDPMERNQHGWCWYAQDIKVPTLWDAAHQAGLLTANVHWPVSVGAQVDLNLPQIWRTGMPDDRKLVRALSTKGLLDELESRLGTYADGQNEVLDGDEIRAWFAVNLIRSHHPAFTTVYLTALDTQQHRTGPFSLEVNAVLEHLDEWVGRLRATLGDRGVFCVASDHGFRAVEHEFDLRKALAGMGLFKKGDKTWEVAPWNCGGSFALVLRDPSNPELRKRVEAILEALKSDPAIERVMNQEELTQRHGFPDAQYYVALKPGYVVKGESEPFSEEIPIRGAHGYLSEDPEMASCFLIAGRGIPRGRDLGAIDMRQIAPTLARILGVKLKDAEMDGVSLQVPTKK
jgi:predicted AlkP superfamily pyrophosphatase or phosphodiesterase